MIDLEQFVEAGLSVAAEVDAHRMTPHITKQVRCRRNANHSHIFPLKARYDHCNLTLEGRVDAHQSVHSSFDLLPDADSSLVAHATAQASSSHEDSRAPSESHDDEGEDRDKVMTALHPRTVVDARGRHYPVDEYGFRIRKSTRPAGVPPEVWSKMNAKRKQEFIEAHNRALAGLLLLSLIHI